MIKLYTFLPKTFFVTLSTLLLFIFVNVLPVYADDLLYTGCLSTGAGVIYNAMEGSTPLHPCASGDSPVLGGGDITGILTSGGLTGGGNAGVVSLSIADLGVTTAKIASSSVTTSKIADGAVTPDKISNDASEPSRIATWVDDSTDFSFDATGATANHVIPSDITITVPSGKAYNYAVTYDAVLSYNYSERASGASSFYGAWSAQLLSDSTEVGISIPVVRTGYRQNWSDLGGSAYWNTPAHATWYIRLPAGTHDLKIQINGYSDNTMEDVHFLNNRLQVMRVF